MGVKVVKTPSIMHAEDVNLYQVERIVELADRSHIVQYLWFTDLMYHEDVADSRWDLFDENEPVTWAAFYVSETDAQECIDAADGKVHDPMVLTNRYGNWYVKRRVPSGGSPKATHVEYLWKHTLEWKIPCFPLDMSASDILNTSVHDSPAAFETWTEAKSVLDEVQP